MPEIKDFFDVEMAFARIEALSNVLLDYIHNEGNDDEVVVRKDNIGFTLMSIRDYAAIYSAQANKLQK